MNIRTFLIVLAAGTALGIQAVCAAEPGSNLLRNPEFKLVKGKVRFWGTRNGKVETMLTEGSRKGRTAVKLMVGKNKSGFFKCGNVLSQAIIKPAGGTYIVTVNLSPSRKFSQAIIINYYRHPKTNKLIYCGGGRIKFEDYPEPGKWKKKSFAITIPEGVKRMGFAVEIRDHKQEGFMKVENPTFILREE